MNDIAAEAETWIDTPFIWQGRVKGVGCDCKGLIAGVAKECGRPEADGLDMMAGDYGAKVDVVRLKTALARLFDKVATPEAGDVLLIKIGGKAQHLAIFAPLPENPMRIIEAMPSGPGRVRPSRARGIDSVWRWRN